MLDTYMSYDEPRAVLGVSNEELEDATLALPLYAKQLGMDMEDLFAGLEDLYTEVKALPVKSVKQQKLLDVVSVYAIYAVSKNLLTSASLFAPRHITDGKAASDRVTDPFTDLRDGVDASLLTMKERVLKTVKALGNSVATVTSRSYFAPSALTASSVTNS